MAMALRVAAAVGAALTLAAGAMDQAPATLKTASASAAARRLITQNSFRKIHLCCGRNLRPWSSIGIGPEAARNGSCTSTSRPYRPGRKGSRRHC